MPRTMRDSSPDQFVTHNEFSEFKESDSRWKAGIDEKIDRLVTSFTNYQTSQSREQSWRNTLPVLAVLLTIGSMAYLPIREAQSRNAESVLQAEERIGEAIKGLNDVSDTRHRDQADDIDHMDEVLQREMRELDRVQEVRVELQVERLDAEIQNLKDWIAETRGGQ